MATPEAPNPKLQSPKKFQIPSSNISTCDASLFGIWCLELLWCLGFGAWNFRGWVSIAGCVRFGAAQTEPVNYALLERPLFFVGGHYVSVLGLLAFAGLFTLG